ncbi:hypothetical protein BCR39DRAFT_484249 [Naematelia encephala]|uniref:Protein CPL1-like domain-containing protein n=1 Tax=Naematelia encephala TaxID=71784 RepID=A0A1Y2AVR2_9TREE|nr:hypothetical protein BCR39DRAFT_484249 [Naematelia encephala]
MNSDCSCIEPTYRKRTRSIRCPPGLSACATYSSSPALKGAFECLDTRSSLEACGGCPGTGGVDCSAIDNADDVTCEQSRCVIRSCAPGFTVNANGTECIEDENSTTATGRRIAVQSLNGIEKFWGL